MKKISKIISLSLMLLIQPIFANNIFNVNINNSTFKVKEAGVTVDDNIVNSEFKPYIKEGRTFVPIREITESLGATVDWDNKDKVVKITLDDKTIEMKIDDTEVKVNGKKTKVDKNQVPELALYEYPREETKTMVPLRFISETFGYDVDWDNDKVMAEIKTIKGTSIIEENDEVIKEEKSNSKINSKSIVDNKDNLSKNYFQSSLEKKETENINEDIKKGNVKRIFDEAELDLKETKKKRIIKDKLEINGKLSIVIDPGHGGKDSGAIAIDEKTYEKDLNLEVAEKLYKKLMENPDVDVNITRTRDEYIKLLDRAALSNDSNADLFLSIHFNSSENKSAKGIEVLYASEKNIQIKETVQKYFAKSLKDSLIKETGAVDRGIKNRPALIVLNKTKNVSALVELGFMSNEDELEKLKDPIYIDKLVDGLYNGIENYIESYVVK